MAVRTDEEIIQAISERLGEDNSDEALNLLTDVRDTLTSKTVQDGEDWHTKYEELDASWRQRYRDAFFGNPEQVDPVERSKPLTFGALFN